MHRSASPCSRSRCSTARSHPGQLDQRLEEVRMEHAKTRRAGYLAAQVDARRRNRDRKTFGRYGR